jgi:hypothetical protein
MFSNTGTFTGSQTFTPSGNFSDSDAFPDSEAFSPSGNGETTRPPDERKGVRKKMVLALAVAIPVFMLLVVAAVIGFIIYRRRRYARSASGDDGDVEEEGFAGALDELPVTEQSPLTDGVERELEDMEGPWAGEFGPVNADPVEAWGPNESSSHYF